MKGDCMMKNKELQTVKSALLKELDVTFQKYCHQRLKDVMNELSIRYVNIRPDSSPDDIFSVVLQSGVLKTISAPPMIHMRESLERLRMGTFGLCKMCGREISAKYLQKNPTTNLCELCISESKKLIQPIR
jgi:RNA polymerase-binding transcription factor DksA